MEYEFEVKDSVGYSETVFYTSVGEKRENTSVHSVRMPAHYAELFGALMGEIPQYSTVSDIIRDALTHRLKYLSRSKKHPELQAKLDEFMAFAEFDAFCAMQAGYKASLERLGRGLWEASTPDAKVRARMLIQEAVNVTSDPEWAQRFRDLLG